MEFVNTKLRILGGKTIAEGSAIWYNVDRHYTRRSAHKLPDTVCEAHGIMSTDIIRAGVRISYQIPCAKHMVFTTIEMEHPC